MALILSNLSGFLYLDVFLSEYGVLIRISKLWIPFFALVLFFVRSSARPFSSFLLPYILPSSPSLPSGALGSSILSISGMAWNGIACGMLYPR